MTAEQVREKIAQELGRVQRAVKTGNFGLARVCGRRAAGMALLYWRERRPEAVSGRSFMEALKYAAAGAGFPEEIRLTALRLVTAPGEAGKAPLTLNPEDDARTIIRYVEEQVGEPLLDPGGIRDL